MSERNLASGVLAELAKPNIQVEIFVELFLDAGTVRLWSGLGNLTIDGNTYTGTGALGGITQIEEDAGDVRATGVAMTLSGIPSSQLGLVLNNPLQGRPAIVHAGFFNAQWQFISLVRLIRGRIDTCEIDIAGDTCTITVRAENHLIDLERPRVRRYTDEDQRNLYPDDRGLEFVASIQNKELIWKQ